MGRRRYTLAATIHEGLDYQAELILTKVEKLFKRYDKEMDEGPSSDAATTIMEIKDILFEREGC